MENEYWNSKDILRSFKVLIPHEDGNTVYLTTAKDGMTARRYAANAMNCPLRITRIIGTTSRLFN